MDHSLQCLTQIGTTVWDYSMGLQYGTSSFIQSLIPFDGLKQESWRFSLDFQQCIGVNMVRSY